MNKRLIGLLLYLLLQVSLKGQEITYSVRGSIKDEVSTSPLIGVLVYVSNFESLSTVTNENGEFILSNIPIGRHAIHTSYIGYAAYSSSIEIKSGKELVIDIVMKEDVVSLNEVVVGSGSFKSKAINTMSYASSRTFSVEESNKYAGAVDDPARMAQSFAGVIPTNDGNNYISIRGNHPVGLLYRLEGIDIPNPNHFGDVASSGGGVSVLSSQMLSNSDFSTGAFSAEYGNALGGVFDLRLRKGNNNKREYTVKIGFLGMEAAAEGPFSKKYKGSFLINYRYSTLSMIDKLGVDLTGVLNYSDLSYNIFLPLKKGSISLFGINGLSNQNLDDDIEDLISNEGVVAHSLKGKFISDMSVNGIKYNTPIGNGFLNVIVAKSKTKGGYQEDARTQYKGYDYFNKFSTDNISEKLSSAVSYTKKLSTKSSIRTGVYFDALDYQLVYNKYINDKEYDELINDDGNTSLIRSYAQLQHSFSKKFSTNIGFHYSQFLLNKKKMLEPRANIQYNFSDKINFAVAYGLHSQIQPLMVYFIKNEEDILINENLDFTKSSHLIVTYNHEINSHTRIKGEVYHQSLKGIPVGTGENHNYAIVNQQFFFPDFELINEGKGKNKGLELTLERFIENNWYYILTGSVFDSKYKTPTSGWINTRFNSQYASSLTLGRDWTVGKSKRNTIGINLKNTIAGGQFDTPIDREASQLAKKEIRDESNPFSVKISDFYKLDVGLKFKRNKRNFTSILSLDIMNATNHRNVGGITYDIQNDKMSEWTTMPLVPIMAYKIEF